MRRLLGRLATLVLLDAGALLLLSALLPGFHADSFGAALILALLLALANALVWPLLIRVALPFTVATLGLGALAHDVLRRALRDGSAPTLARWARG